MFILHVIPFQRSTHQEELSYFSIHEVALGACVEMPYGTRTLLGAVTSCVPLADMKSQVKNMSFQLKNIHRVLPSSPVSPAVLSAIEECSGRTLIPRNTLFDRILPVQFLESIRGHLDRDVFETSTGYHFAEHHITLLQQSEPDRIDIYMTRVREVLSSGTSVVIIASSVSGVEVLGKKIGKGIEKHVVLLHGHLTKKKQSQAYEKLLDTNHGVVCIMTPYFLGCIPPSASLVIVHNSASSEYLSPTKPYIDFIPLIEGFARASGIECMLSDTLLPLKITLRVDTDPLVSWYTHASYRNIGNLTFKALEHDFSKNIIHPEVIERIKENLQESKKIAFFVPRTGYASITKCNDCQHVMSCPTCDAPLRLHRSSKTQHTCSRCKASIPPIDACQKCNGSRLAMLGISVGKVIEALSDHINTEQIISITRETMSKKKNIKSLDTLMNEDTGICCVATQALLGLPYQFDTLVIVSAAHLFAHHEYNSYEASLRMGMRLREHVLKEFFIQTPTQYTSLVHTYWSMPIQEQLTYEDALRKEYELPPYVRKAHIICPLETIDAMKALMKAPNHIFTPYQPTILNRMPYHGYRGGICIEISFHDTSDLVTITRFLDGLKKQVYLLEK